MDSAHPPETSAAHVERPALCAGMHDTAGAVRRRLRTTPTASWDLLCVVDDAMHLIGVLTPAELLALPDERLLIDAARRDHPHADPGVDQERLASLALTHRLNAVPLVDGTGRLLGVVGAAALMSILRREHVEDLHRIAGITRETQQARHALESPPLRRARHRLPWLIAGLAGSVLATMIVAGFETALTSKPALAFFVPGLVYLADAIGTQSEAVAVRGLSLTNAGVARLVGGELRTGLLIGLVLALLAFPMVWIAFGELRLAAAVALSLAGASAVPTVLGLLLPWALGRIGSDPAYGSGPLATIVQDLLTLLIYFGFARLIVL